MVEIELSGVRGVLAGSGVSAAFDLQLELNGVYF